MPSKLKVVPEATKEQTVITKDTESLELVELNVQSFKGIDKTQPLVIDFREHTGKNITIVKGDQGVGKSSTIEALLYACGETFDFKLENFINNQDNTISVKLKFKKNNRHYEVLVNKNKFELKKLFRDTVDKTEQWVAQSSPKELLRELIGNIATSPMFLKEEKRGEKQVEWLLSLLNVPEAIKARQAKLLESLAKITESRKDANREANRIQAILSENDMYKNWDDSEKAYSVKKDMGTVKAKWQEADTKRQQYVTAQSGLASFKKELKEKDKEISELEMKLELLKKSRNTVEKRIAAGEKFVNENKNVMEEYDKAYKELEEINTYTINFEKWKRTIEQKQELDEFEDYVIKLDGQKDQHKKEIKDLLKSILPPIDGLEVETEESIDKKRNTGIYVFGKTPAQLSESELTSFYLQVLKTQNISMVVVENITSFGSFSIETINQLAKEGVKIFATQMDRNIKDRAISFTTSIE